MIELQKDSLVFRFPDVHSHAVLRIGFQRTLRIPDDEKKYPLPPVTANSTSLSSRNTWRKSVRCRASRRPVPPAHSRWEGTRAISSRSRMPHRWDPMSRLP